MYESIRELRYKTGLTQKAFAEHFGIPLSTLRKWEQGESRPAAYITGLIARSIPACSKSFRTLPGSDGKIYYYDSQRLVVADSQGNEIHIGEPLEEVKPQNLGLYLNDLFEDLYRARERFERDCSYDREEEIIWN